MRRTVFGLDRRVVSLPGIKEFVYGVLMLVEEPGRTQALVYGKHVWRDRVGIQRRKLTIDVDTATIEETKPLYMYAHLLNNNYFGHQIPEELGWFEIRLWQTDLYQGPKKEWQGGIQAKPMPSWLCDLVQALISRQVEGDQILKGLRALNDVRVPEGKLTKNYVSGWMWQSADGITQGNAADFLNDVILSNLY